MTDRDLLSEGDRALLYRVDTENQMQGRFKELELMQRNISANAADGPSNDDMVSHRTEIKTAVLADGTEIKK